MFKLQHLFVAKGFIMAGSEIRTDLFSPIEEGLRRLKNAAHPSQSAIRQIKDDFTALAHGTIAEQEREILWGGISSLDRPHKGISLRAKIEWLEENFASLRSGRPLEPFSIERLRQATHSAKGAGAKKNGHGKNGEHKLDSVIEQAATKLAKELKTQTRRQHKRHGAALQEEPCAHAVHEAVTAAAYALKAVLHGHETKLRLERGRFSTHSLTVENVKDILVRAVALQEVDAAQGKEKAWTTYAREALFNYVGAKKTAGRVIASKASRADKRNDGVNERE